MPTKAKSPSSRSSKGFRRSRSRERFVSDIAREEEGDDEAEENEGLDEREAENHRRLDAGGRTGVTRDAFESRNFFTMKSMASVSETSLRLLT